MFLLNAFNVKRRQTLPRENLCVRERSWRINSGYPIFTFAFSRNGWLLRNITATVAGSIEFLYCYFVTGNIIIFYYLHNLSATTYQFRQISLLSHHSIVFILLSHTWIICEWINSIEIWHLVQPFISCSQLDINLSRIHQSCDIYSRNASRACRDFANDLQGCMDACKPSPMTHG